MQAGNNKDNISSFAVALTENNKEFERRSYRKLSPQSREADQEASGRIIF